MSKPLLLKLKDKLKIAELYYRENPEYLSATLSDSITNYDLIIVIGQSSDNYDCSTTIYKPKVGNKISLKAGQVDSDITFNKQAVYEFTSEKIIQSIQNYEERSGKVYEGNFIRLKAILGINF